jgi:PIN domain nuclease of toxin-antitoxin system
VSSERLLLDTHIALWLDSGSPHLRRTTRAVLDQHWQNGGEILLSAVSAWEIALLVDAEKVELDLPVAAWVERFVNRPGVESVALTHSAAARAYQMSKLEHRDPADRLLIATAIELACPLVTYDARISRFASRYGSQHRFSVRS